MARECDYKLEAENQKKYRELLKHDKAFYVPMVYDEFSSRRVLTTELVRGYYPHFHVYIVSSSFQI